MVLRGAALVAASLALSAATACGGSSTPTGAAGPGRIVVPDGVSARIDVHRGEGRPALAAVVREGDPTAAMAVVLLVDDHTSRAAPALAAILEGRLQRGLVRGEARVARGAVILALDLERAEPARTIANVRAVLAGPIKALDVDALATATRRTGELAGPAVSPGLESAARCAGWPVEAAAAAAPAPAAPGAGPAAPLDLASPGGLSEVERLRATAVTARTVSIGVVGDERAVESAVAAVEDGSAWPAGPGTSRATHAAGPRASTFVAAGAAGVTPGSDLVLAIDLPRASAAPALARGLAAPAAPLASRLRLLAPGLEITSASGLARAGGGGSCLRLDLAATRREALDPAAAALAAELVRSAVAAPPSPAGEVEVAARAIIEAADPREAAARAAWWATSGDAPPGAPRIAVALGVGAGGEGAGELLARALQRPVATPAPTLERRVRVEAGQGAFRMILATPCAPAIEGDVAAAETAIALVAAARNVADRGLEVEPFVEGGAAGLLARATARPGEPPAELARRVAAALARGLAGPPPSAPELSDARFRLVEHASRAFGHAEAADALSHGIAATTPTLLAPLGLELALVRADAEQAGARLAALLRSPLRAAVIANGDAAQAEIALRAIEEHLPAVPPRACQVPAPSAAAAGRADVRVPADDPFAQIALGLVMTRSPASADLAALLLGAADGPIARAAAGVGGSARATRFGDTGVRLDVRVSPERIEEALAAVEAALGALSRGEIAAAALREARIGAVEQARGRAADPNHRLRDLFLGIEPGSTTEPLDPQAVAAELGFARWTVVVARPG